MKYIIKLIFCLVLLCCENAAMAQENNTTKKKLNVQIMLPAMYRGSELSDFNDMLSGGWCDFYQDLDTKKYFLKKAEVQIEKAYDDCLQDSATIIRSQRDPLLLISGLKAQKVNINTLILEKKNIWVEEQMSFEFNKKEYSFHGEGITVESNEAWIDGFKTPQRWDVVKDYKLYLLEKSSGKKQLLLSIPTFNDTFVQILWVGDLDNDGKPDFIFDTSPDYEYKRVELFLSSQADKDEIVKKVGESSYDFSC